MNTYTGATRALKDVPYPFNFVAAATTIASGFLSVKKIMATPLPNNAGAGMSAGASMSAPVAPQIPQAQTTNLSQSTINDIGNQAVRAYVVESDVTSNQQRIAAIRQRARFS
jgi:galactokinase